MDEIVVYYLYKDENGKEFYYNTKDNTSTWIYPIGSTVIDPEIKEFVERPLQSRRRTGTTVINKKKMKRTSNSNSNLSTIINENIQNMDSLLIEKSMKESMSNVNLDNSNNIKHRKSVRIRGGAKHLLNIEAKDITSYHGKPLYYPQEIEKDVISGDISIAFSKFEVKGKNITPTFQNFPIKSSITNIEKSLVKNAKLIFKTILKYSCVRPSKQTPGTITYFIDLIKSDKQLVDESYMQLIKQTNDNPNEKSMLLTLRMFLTVISLFNPSQNLHRFIRSHLAKIIQTAIHQEIKSIALFTYIRAISLFNSGYCISLENLSNEYLSALPFSNIEASNQFNVSLQEMMWNQNKKYPNLPIPIFVHLMVESMITKNCQHSQGIFRLPGNMSKVNQMIIQANQKNYSFLVDGQIHDIASLFKLWFREIPGSLINNEKTLNLLQIEKDKYSEFVESLDILNQNVLMYLIGFLHELSLTSNDTMMGVSNLSMVFAPNLINSSNNPSFNAKITSAATHLISVLIETWDTSPIYPLPSRFVQNK